MGSINTVRGLMQRHDLYARKGMGQNFLLDQNIINKIAESADIEADDYIVEIGPGLGSLTQALAKRSQGVLAIDIDLRLKAVLEETLADYSNVEVVFQDILKTDIENELIKAFELKEIKPYKVCANIPYNITTPIIFQLLKDCPHMQSAVLMMQKEVGNRILASPGNKDYGRLTVAVGCFAKIEHILNVSSNCFYPRPQVDSVVLKFTPNQNPDYLQIDEACFHKLLNTAFQQRRKTILNICAGFFNQDKSVVKIKLQQLGLDPNLRPENLSQQDYINLLKEFNENRGYYQR
ncbi:16S rRNA (adenine(1518)-N(6)/adenine(1519)-N(6))-dimethyltransferase RsmA [Syntrophomonas zehnderi]|uniref:16S rRNA (adenine(1518)-N(6)/adenine(1519)-N(6))- dimethyltransferase RsmA n=1 Tax=Syntrophomonas zehnderi TaxID=404335 RepID=UPI001A9A615E|nr:16S rRNA (adenine(1518)-N(6)/adenine(1519)-N(6))-dimethyltransferase RsmA [Syntrophomonas zehnderi]